MKNKKDVQKKKDIQNKAVNKTENKKVNIEDINEFIKDATLFYNRRQFKKAKDLFIKVLDKDPSNPESNYYLGLIFSRDENWPKAVVHFKAVVDFGANFLYTQQCRILLGIIYFKNKDYLRAEQEFMEVLKSKVNIVQVYAALACIKYYLNDKDEALKYAEKAFDIDSYNLNAKNTYAFMLCDYNIDIQKGLEMLKEVVRVKPSNPAYLDSLGWAYYKKGDKKSALTSLKKAYEISNNHPEIKEHLQTVYRN